MQGLLYLPSEGKVQLSSCHNLRASSPNCLQWQGTMGQRASPPGLCYSEGLRADKWQAQLSLPLASGAGLLSLLSSIPNPIYSQG